MGMSCAELGAERETTVDQALIRGLAETDDARANDETLDRFHPNSLLQAERSSAQILQPAKRILAKTGRRSRIVALVKLNSNTPRGRLFESHWRRSLKREKSTRNESFPDPPK
jgi:hypothetical protein